MAFNTKQLLDRAATAYRDGDNDAFGFWLRQAEGQRDARHYQGRIDKAKALPPLPTPMTCPAIPETYCGQCEVDCGLAAAGWPTV